MARFCTECGKEIADKIAFCTACGASVSAGAPSPAESPQMNSAPPPVNTPVVAPAQAPPRPASIPTGEAVPGKGSKYEPMTTGGYIGSMLLMSIPVLG